MIEKRDTRWFCINPDCGAVLGKVIGSELYVSEDIKDVRTRGVNLVIACSNCGTKKVWYTSDPIVKAIYQLIDAMSSAAASRMIKQVGKDLHY
jgi:hypothetical protein